MAVQALNDNVHEHPPLRWLYPRTLILATRSGLIQRIESVLAGSEVFRSSRTTNTLQLIAESAPTVVFMDRNYQHNGRSLPAEVLFKLAQLQSKPLVIWINKTAGPPGTWHWGNPYSEEELLRMLRNLYESR